VTSFQRCQCRALLCCQKLLSHVHRVDARRVGHEGKCCARRTRMCGTLHLGQLLGPQSICLACLFGAHGELIFVVASTHWSSWDWKLKRSQCL
jgi:hypothetical protein